MLSVDSVCEIFSFRYTQLVAVNVVAIAVRMVITTLRILPQRVLLLKVPIFNRVQIKEYRVQLTEYRVIR